MKTFAPISLRNLSLENRLVRSATFEGMSDHDGVPTAAYIAHYARLAQSGVGLIITGFSYVSKAGSAIQPGQAGINHDDKIAAFRQVTDAVHQTGSKIALQIAHTGRQTQTRATGCPVLGVSAKRSFYFKDRPKALNAAEIHDIIGEFVSAAVRAREAGFDAVQLHAAHGYLIHHFILPYINDRQDTYGVDKTCGIGTAFLDQVIDGIRNRCGEEFPILVKLSGSDDYPRPFTREQFVSLVRFLDTKQMCAIEVSFGTMDHALNIFRGETIPFDTILDADPVYKSQNRLYRFLWRHAAVPVLSRKLKPFTPCYNLPYARLAKAETRIPVIAVGGFRSGDEIERALTGGDADLVALCRPFIAEPNFASKLRCDRAHRSTCVNCNICAVMTGAGVQTACRGARRK